MCKTIASRKQLHSTGSSALCSVTTQMGGWWGWKGREAHKGGGVCMCMCAKLLQSRPTLWDPMDCSLPDSSVHGNSPGKNTGVDCHALLPGYSQPRNRTRGSHITDRFLTVWATWEAQGYWSSPGELPDPGTEPKSSALQVNSLPLSHQGSPINTLQGSKYSVND